MTEVIFDVERWPHIRPIAEAARDLASWQSTSYTRMASWRRALDLLEETAEAEGWSLETLEDLTRGRVELHRARMKRLHGDFRGDRRLLELRNLVRSIEIWLGRPLDRFPAIRTGRRIQLREPVEQATDRLLLLIAERALAEQEEAPPPQTLALVDLAPAVTIIARLTAKGRAKIAQKLGEEAVETVIEAIRDDRAALTAESADLLYHLAVLWADAGVDPADVWAELDRRAGTSGLAEKAARGQD